MARDDRVYTVLAGLGLVHLVLTVVLVLEFFLYRGPIHALDQWQWLNSVRGVRRALLGPPRPSR
jgi:hypothetical protein